VNESFALILTVVGREKEQNFPYASKRIYQSHARYFETAAKNDASD
jgi:hypothetical protein